MPVALVTGASRGVGRGIAAQLIAEGFEVFAAGRSILSANLPASAVRIPVDLANPGGASRLFSWMGESARSLDIVVNAAWGGYERMVEDGHFTWTQPFWKQPAHRWDSMIDAGVGAAFFVSAQAAAGMVERGSGLIVNLSFWSAQKYVGNSVYGIAKAATDKLTADTAHELRPHGVSVVSLYPGMVRTESVLAAAEAGWLDLSNSESPEFQGRVIAALQRDPRLAARSGKALVTAELAAEYGLCDIDGRTPRALTLSDV